MGSESKSCSWSERLLGGLFGKDTETFDAKIVNRDCFERDTGNPCMPTENVDVYGMALYGSKDELLCVLCSPMYAGGMNPGDRVEVRVATSHFMGIPYRRVTIHKPDGSEICPAKHMHRYRNDTSSMQPTGTAMAR